MTDLAPFPVRDDMVTASELVRQFGTWRERAAQSPVYILHRGRPRLVLASVAVMDALCEPHDESRHGDRERLTALLAASPDLIVIADHRLSIVSSSRPVRARMGDLAAPGAPLAGLVPPNLAPFLVQAAERVALSARAEAIELPLAGAPQRLLALAIEPHPDGIVVFARDLGDAEAVTEAAEDRAAIDRAMTSSGRAAFARVNLRGYIEGPHPVLAALTGIAAETIAAVRLVTLFAVESRVALGDAVEAVIAQGAPQCLSAELLMNRGEPRPVTVALAPLHRGAAIQGVKALIITV
jgi:PAS domain-containing protein